MLVVAQKAEHRTTMWSSNSTPRFIPKIIEKGLKVILLSIAVFIATLFTIAQRWKNPKCPSQMDG